LVLLINVHFYLFSETFKINSPTMMKLFWWIHNTKGKKKYWISASFIPIFLWSLKTWGYSEKPNL